MFYYVLTHAGFKISKYLIIIFSFLIYYNCSSYNIVYEKNYNLGYSSSFTDGFVSSDNNLILSCMKLDSAKLDEEEFIYSNIVKLSNDGKLAWDVLGNRFSYNTLIFENQNNQITSIDDHFNYHNLSMIADFNLISSRISLNGELINKRIDSNTNQYKRMLVNGTTFRASNNVLNAIPFLRKDSVLSIILKYYDYNCNFSKEDTLGLIKASDTLKNISLTNSFVLNDTEFYLFLNISGKKGSQNIFILRFALNDTNFNLRGLQRYNTSNEKGLSYSVKNPCTLR